MTMIPKIRIDHIYKEANWCAEALAKLGSSLHYTIVVFDNQLFVVENLLALNRVANACNRRVSI